MLQFIVLIFFSRHRKSQKVSITSRSIKRFDGFSLSRWKFVKSCGFRENMLFFIVVVVVAAAAGAAATAVVVVVVVVVGVFVRNGRHAFEKRFRTNFVRLIHSYIDPNFGVISDVLLIRPSWAKSLEQ